MNSVAIVGAGITGLTAAFYLQAANIPVDLYESSSQAGGMIGTTSRDGFLCENGPNTILESAPEISSLVRDLNLTSRCLYPAPGMNARYLVRDGRTLPMPQSPLGAVRTPLLSLRGKMRVLREPFVPRGVTEDETLAGFVRRRLGSELLDYFIDPFVGGVYAGDPSRLSVAYAFPKLHALEQTYGSLIKGTILGARARRKRATKSKVSSPMLTFDRGLGVFVDALVEALQSKPGAALHLQSRVSRVSRVVAREGSAWSIETNGLRREHSAVILCTPAHSVAGMNIDDVPQQDLKTLGEVYYPPIARVALGFPRDRIAHALDGFGVLIPSKEHMNTLGILFLSSLFPNRAPDGCALLTAFLGGSRGLDVRGMTDAGLIDLALTDMKKLLGVSGSPVFSDVLRVPLSIPQYNVGYGEVKSAIGNIEARAKGIFVASSYSQGISVADCIVGGKAASGKVSQYVARA
jgi:oxygen-dependent protoporphyrinogen oxidase